MSNHWESFPCTIGDHAAFISYDHGVSEELADLPFAYFVSFRVGLADPDERGLPHGDEFIKLNTLEDWLCARLTPEHGIQIGRATCNGHRSFAFYTDLSTEACQALMMAASDACGYSDIALLHEEDAEREHYWKQYFPTLDDWQVMQDVRVQESLRQSGDPLTEAREIEHWAYFRDASARAAFVDKVGALAQVQELYQVDEPDDRGAFVVKLMHVGLPDYQSINKVTLGLSRAAREAGGDYDGWETPVCR